jgi:hypothetical protein
MNVLENKVLLEGIEIKIEKAMRQSGECSKNVLTVLKVSPSQ